MNAIIKSLIDNEKFKDYLENIYTFDTREEAKEFAEKNYK